MADSGFEMTSRPPVVLMPATGDGSDVNEGPVDVVVIWRQRGGPSSGADARASMPQCIRALSSGEIS